MSINLALSQAAHSNPSPLLIHVLSRNMTNPDTITVPGRFNDDFLLLNPDQFARLVEFEHSVRLCKSKEEKHALSLQLRNSLLSESTGLSLLFDACARVITENLPGAIDSTNDAEWTEFRGTAQKGRKTRDRCLAPLKRIAKEWGDEVVQHYHLASAGPRYLESFRTAVIAVPDFQEGIMKLNRLLDHRRSAVGQYQFRDSHNPIDVGDLKGLRDWKGKEDYGTTGLRYAPLTTDQLPSGFGFDKFGLLVREEYAVRNSIIQSGSAADAAEDSSHATEDAISDGGDGEHIRDCTSHTENTTAEDSQTMDGADEEDAECYSSAVADTHLTGAADVDQADSADGSDAENTSSPVEEDEENSSAHEDHSPPVDGANSEAEGYTTPAEEDQASSEAEGYATPPRDNQAGSETGCYSPAKEDQPDSAAEDSSPITKASSSEVEAFALTAVADTRDLIGGAGIDQATSAARTDAEDLANSEAPGHSPAEDGQASSATGADGDHPPSVEDKQSNPLTDPGAGRVLRRRAGKPYGAQGGGTPLKRRRPCCNDVPVSLVKALDNPESLSAEQYRPYKASLCHRHTQKLLQLFLDQRSPILDPPLSVSGRIPSQPGPTTSRRRRCSMSDIDGIADLRGPTLKRRRLASMLTRDDTDSSNYQDHSPEWKGAVSEYIERTKKAIKDMRELMRTANKPNKEAKTRFQVQVRKYEEILRRCTPGKPITADEYLAGKWNGPTDRFVLCSSEEAKSILTKAPPLLPIFVPPLFNPGVELLSLGQYLAVLETRRTLDVHDFDAEGDTQEPVEMESRQATALFREDGKTINMLSLPGYKQNSTPSCIAGIQALTILEAIEEAENGNVLLPTDLRPSFQLCGNKGSFSFDHMDSASTITSTQCDHGEKLWPLWPGHGLKDILKWAESDELPDGPCVGIHLWAGCLLIQPPACIHAPSSVTDVLMTGTRHWDSRAMLQVMESVKIELKYPHVTNEPMAREFLGKMKRIRELWDDEHKAWPWGSRAEFGQFTEHIEVRNPSPIQVLN